jgi:protein phosphatase PTC2/3
MQPENKKDVKNWPQCSFFGVFDGHGGATCSDFLRDNLHHFIIRDVEFPKNPRQALMNGFKYAEECFINLVEEGAKSNSSSLDKSGSCATWTLFVDDTCYVVNLGDSRTIMSSDLGNKIWMLSRDHKPTDEVEKERITKYGGSVYQTQTVARPSNSGTGNFMSGMFNTPTQILLGPHRVMPGRLSVSRTFGDIEAK